MAENILHPDELLGKYGERVALVCGSLELDGSTYLEQIRSYSCVLKQIGVKSGDRIALHGKNSIELAVLILAVISVGAVAMPVDPKMSEIAFRKLFSEIKCDHIIDLNTMPSQPAVNTSYHRWEDIWREHKNQPNPDASFSFAPAGDATILLTSGSSGTPKAVVHTWANHYYSALGSNSNIKLEPGDRWLVALPLHHTGGLSILFRTLLAGAAAVISEDSMNLKQNLEDPRISHVSLVWTQLFRFLESGAGLKALRDKKAILLGGGPPSQKTYETALSHNLNLFVSYGSTEMCSQITTTPPGKPLASGKILPYREIRTDAHNNIYVKGQTLFRGYITTSGVKKDVDNEGWFKTGDRGILDSRGFLTVLGRNDNMFVSGGENIYPEEIERVLEEIDIIDMALVVDIPDQEFGKRPAAFLLRNSPADPGEDWIKNFLRKKLPGYKIPLRFFEWPPHLGRNKPSRETCRRLAAKAIKS